MKHFNKAANGTAANHHQVDITFGQSYIRNINIKINDNNKMSKHLILGSLIRKCFDIVKTYRDYENVIKANVINVAVIEKNMITISVAVKSIRVYVFIAR